MKPNPHSCPSNSYTRHTHLGKIDFTVTWNDTTPVSVVGHSDVPNECFQGEVNAIGGLASIVMEHGVSIDEVIHQLKDITCTPIWDRGEQIKSVADAFASVLYEADKDGPPDMEGIVR